MIEEFQDSRNLSDISMLVDLVIEMKDGNLIPVLRSDRYVNLRSRPS